MKLSELGEKRIVEKILESIEKCEGVVEIGDDAFAVEFGEFCLVGSIDMVTQSRHIPKEMTPRQIGKYAVNAGLSDIASMGAIPLGILVSLALPREREEDFLLGVVEGISEACRDHGTCVLGGDTKDHVEITLTVCSLGKVGKSNLLTRGNAEVGDLICVTGKLGSAPAGFVCLTRNLDFPKFVAAALEPKARVKEGVILGKYANSCMDISDGLAYSLHEIADRSGKGFIVYEEKIPVDGDIYKVAEKAKVDAREMIFYSGGDYELLFTISEEKFDFLKKKIKCWVIGEVVERERKLISIDGEEIELEKRGDEAFQSKWI